MKDCTYCQNQREIENADGKPVRCPACSPSPFLKSDAARAMEAAAAAVEKAKGLPSPMDRITRLHDFAAHCELNGNLGLAEWARDEIELLLPFVRRAA